MASAKSREMSPEEIDKIRIPLEYVEKHKEYMNDQIDVLHDAIGQLFRLHALKTHLCGETLMPKRDALYQAVEDIVSSLAAHILGEMDEHPRDVISEAMDKIEEAIEEEERLGSDEKEIQ